MKKIFVEILKCGTHERVGSYYCWPEDIPVACNILKTEDGRTWKAFEVDKTDLGYVAFVREW